MRPVVCVRACGGRLYTWGTRFLGRVSWVRVSRRSRQEIRATSGIVGHCAYVDPRGRGCVSLWGGFAPFCRFFRASWPRTRQNGPKWLLFADFVHLADGIQLIQEPSASAVALLASPPAQCVRCYEGKLGAA